MKLLKCMTKKNVDNNYSIPVKIRCHESL